MVPERGADPRPPDFQSGASTELASQANWSGRRESNPRRTRWQRAILPLNYVRVWWIGHGFEPANPEGTAFTAPLLWPLAYLSELGSGGRNRTDCAFRRELMRLASAGACLRVKWRKAEVLILNALRHPSRFERERDTRRVDFPNWRKAESTIPTGSRLPAAFQAAPVPDRLAFRSGGGVKGRSPHVAVRTVFKTGSASSPITPPFVGHRAASRTRISHLRTVAPFPLSYATLLRGPAREVFRGGHLRDQPVVLKDAGRAQGRAVEGLVERGQKVVQVGRRRVDEQHGQIDRVVDRRRHRGGVERLLQVLAVALDTG